MLKIRIAFPAVFQTFLNKDFMSCSHCTLQFFYHHLHFNLSCSIIQTLAWANNLPKSDKLVQTWESTALAPSSFNYLRYLLQLKLDREITQKRCMSQSLLTKKKGRTLCYNAGRTDMSCRNYFLRIVQGCSEVLVQILEVGYEIILSDAHPTKMWVHSSLPFWEK